MLPLTPEAYAVLLTRKGRERPWEFDDAEISKLTKRMKRFAKGYDMDLRYFHAFRHSLLIDLDLHRAQALVMIVVAWVRLPDSRGHLDPSIRPSEAADRKEMVALLLENRSTSAIRLILILRDAKEGFMDFEPKTSLDFSESKGLFSKLMPRHQPRADDCTKEKRTLLAIGMNMENRGFDPTMN